MFDHDDDDDDDDDDDNDDDKNDDALVDRSSSNASDIYFVSHLSSAETFFSGRQLIQLS